MDLSPKRVGYGLFLCCCFLSAIVSAAEIAGSDGGERASVDSVKTLDRRTKMFEHISWNDDVSAQGAVAEFGGGGLGVFDAFFASFSMILVSEIGDETFIIAALMAMRHPKSIVLSGALSALVVMTVLSTGLGRIVPNLISRKHTNSAATVLYAFFGLRLLYIAWRSDSKASQKKEMEEVEEKLESQQGKTTVRRFFSRFCTPIFLESFILTFLAEWGDRSQIATIACLIDEEMRDRVERFIVLPFSIGCVSESSIVVIDERQKKPSIATDQSTQQKDKTYREEGGEGKRVKNSSGFLSLQRQSTAAVLQKLMKSFRDLSAQIFSEKEEEEEMEMEIGFPTDVQHVGHIGWDGSNKASQLLSKPSISFRQFEFAMVDQENCNGKRNLVV